jgi:hypothetical protein
MRHFFTKFLVLFFAICCGGGSPPGELSPRVVKSLGVTLSASRTLKDVNIVTDIDVAQNGHIIAVGNQGATVLSSTLEPLSSGSFGGFSLFRADAIIHPAATDSVVVISTFDGNPQIAAFRLDGRSLWKYEEKNPLVSGTHGLLPEIGPAGAVVVSHAQRGLMIFDAKTGSLINVFRAPFAPEVRAGDLDGDGRSEIVQMNESGLDVRSNDGHLLSHRNIVASWAVARGLGSPDALAIWDGSNFELLGANLVAQETIRGTFTGSEIPALHLEAAAVVHGGDRGLSAFLLGGRGGWHRTTLLIYDATGQLLHHEILPDDFMSLRFIRPNSLLVGGRNVLRLYAIKHGTA